MATSSTIRHQQSVLWLLCLAQFILVLDFSIVNIALPTMQEDLGFSAGQVPWVVGAYALFFGGFLLVGGRVGDFFGRKQIFAVGLVVFAIASLVGGLAVSPEMLIVARALQGISAAVVSPAVLALIGAGYPEGEKRNHAMGVFGAVSSAGFTGGVLAGGVLTEYFGWRAVLFINIPICIALALIGSKKLANDRPTQRTGKLDIPSAILVTTAMCAISYSLTIASDLGWLAPQVMATAAIGLFLLLVFIFLQRRLTYPLMPLDIFRSRNVAGGNIIAFLSGGVMAISTYFFTMYMQISLGYSAIGAGLAFFPQALIVVLASLPAVRLTDRFGAKPVLVGGGCCLVAGSLLMSFAPENGTFVLNILPGGLLIGLGVTVMMITTAVAATSGIAKQEMGLASGIYNSLRQLGVGLCLAAAAAAAGVGAGSASIEGIQTGFLISTGLALAIALVAAMVLPSRIAPSLIADSPRERLSTKPISQK